MSEQWSEIGNQVADKISHTLQRFEQRLTLANPKFIERYLAGELQLIVHFCIGRSKEYVADFQRHYPARRPPEKVPISERDFEGWGQESSAVEMAENVHTRHGGHDSKNEAVFVDVIKSMEAPKVNHRARRLFPLDETLLMAGIKTLFVGLLLVCLLAEGSSASLV